MLIFRQIFRQFVFPILYPPLENLITRIAIMRVVEIVHFFKLKKVLILYSIVVIINLI